MGIEPKSKYLYEVSWEVCNKVGGIYTVVKSKAALMKEHIDNYTLIGPYFEDKAKVELEKKEIPDDLRKIFKELEAEGIKCYYGSWAIPSEPKVILIDSSAYAQHKNEFKKKYWESHKIESMFSGWDFEEPMVWATAVGRLLEKLTKKLNSDNITKISAHFHEWLAGFAMLYLKNNNVPIGGVFTTHATMLGRTLCAQNWNLYESLENLDPEKEARRYNVMDKFSVERACAQSADAFTTVSEITGIEAEKILGRKPDVLVLNGLDMNKFPTIEETSIKHSNNRNLIREFLSYYFYPYYNMELDNNLIFFIVGRYEYKNKGMDIMTKALGKLNERLKNEGSERTISVFYWIPGDARGIKKELLENKTYYRHIKNYITRYSEKLQRNIIKNVLSQKRLNLNEIFTKEFVQNNKKHMLGFKRNGIPPLVTHELGNENEDAILNGFKNVGLLNRKEDKVKVILYPVYLNGADGLIDLPYYDALVGCHLGIFPSYYEPWGYTPLESAALGVPAITTDLAGFGRFIKKDDRVDTSGIFVLKRFSKSEEEVVSNFTETMYNFAMLNRHQRVANKVDAKELAELADWKELINNYFEAHNIALKNRGL